jgi:hypothetical protein
MRVFEVLANDEAAAKRSSTMERHNKGRYSFGGTVGLPNAARPDVR